MTPASAHGYPGDFADAYRLLFEKSPQPMWVLDRETLAFLDVNEAALDHYGYRRDEFLALTACDIRPPEELERFLQSCTRATVPGIPGLRASRVWKHRKRDRTVIDVEEFASPLQFCGREALLVAAVDVTARRLAEEDHARRERQAALRADVSDALAQGTALPAMLQRCTEAVVRRLGAAFARIWTLAPGADVLELQASAGLYTHRDGPHSRILIGSAKIGQIAQERRPHLSNDVPNDPRIADPEWARREGMAAFAGYPLLVEGQSVGVLGLFARRTLTNDTLEALASVADAIAQGIERLRIQEAVRSSEARLRRLVEANLLGILQADASGLITEANEAFLDMVGYTRADLQAGQVRWDRLTPPEYSARDRQALAQARQTGACVPYEKELLRPDGSRVPVLIGEAVMPGSPPRGIGFVLDLTERKRAERALRESEERHRLISELTSDYSYSARILPNGQVVVEAATDGLVQVTGYTVPELEARGGWPALIHPDDVPAVEVRGQRWRAGERDVNEARIVTRDGRVRWVRYSVLPLRDEREGRITRLLGAVQDITDRKEAETRLQGFALEMETLSRRLLEVQEQERRHLARELHDEVGQDLTGLRLTLHLAETAHGKAQTQKFAEARQQVQDLMAKVRALSSQLRPTVLDDLGLLHALLWHFERYTARTHVRVVFRHSGLGERLGAAVETGAYRIIQEALTNVARHAGVVEAEVEVRREPGRLRLCVQDRGAGFDSAAPRSGSVSGGLSGMRERALLLGGRLEIASEPGGGTQVAAVLPTGEPPAAPGAGPAAP